MYRGDALRELAFPLGGIGTGSVSLGGRGELRDWEIFNRPGKGRSLPFSFFALWAQRADEAPVARVLERRRFTPHIAPRGLPVGSAAGLPRLSEVEFRGEYPFAWLSFRDDALPVEVELEAFTPFVPLDADASGVPGALFNWTLTNSGSEDVRVSLALSQLNPVGYDGRSPLLGRRNARFGGNRNEFRDAGDVRGIFMTGETVSPTDPGAGSLAITTTWPTVHGMERWERSGWYDDLQGFWDAFRADGQPSADGETTPTPAGTTDVGSLCLLATIEPGDRVTLPVALTWHFPNLVNYWDDGEPVLGARVGNYYATRFEDAWDVACHLAADGAELASRTRSYHSALFRSTLPAPVLDAVSSQVSTLRTPTSLRTEDGRFHAFEGCLDDAGSCPMDCTHVWHYQQALAFLFPDLERSMRETEFEVNTLPTGEQAFRSLLPTSSGAIWSYHPAADGQMGTLIKLYRDWQLGAGDEFLARMWPHATRALEFAWTPGSWDGDRDGVMEGEQHNTYDVEFYGPNSMTGSIYLAALRAAAVMAAALGEHDAASRCARLADDGAQALVDATWNDEYFEQRVAVSPTSILRSIPNHVSAFYPGEAEPRYQYGSGCMADQVVGQWMAHVAGLGRVLPRENVRSALTAVVRHNWRDDLSNHESCQRTFALNDEQGLLLCTWPHGGRPAYPFPYADEVWTGCEYQVAAHLIYEGLVEDGVRLVTGARRRYDGVRRNPWNEFECGHHYARAMSSWSLLLALSGFTYSAPQRRLGFAPAVAADDFRCLYTTAGAWGVYHQRRSESCQTHTVEVVEGRLSILELGVRVPSTARSPRAHLGEAPADALSIKPSSDGHISVGFPSTLTIESHRPLELVVEW